MDDDAQAQLRAQRSNEESLARWFDQAITAACRRGDIWNVSPVDRTDRQARRSALPTGYDLDLLRNESNSPSVPIAEAFGFHFLNRMHQGLRADVVDAVGRVPGHPHQLILNGIVTATHEARPPDGFEGEFPPFLDVRGLTVDVSRVPASLADFCSERLHRSPLGVDPLAAPSRDEGTNRDVASAYRDPFVFGRFAGRVVPHRNPREFAPWRRVEDQFRRKGVEALGTRAPHVST